MLSLEREGRGWPHRAASRIVAAGPHRWHVQEVGEGPAALLLHGAGASTRSWASVIDRLSGEMRLVAIDLPGHGFTRLGGRARSGLAPMAEDIALLMDALDIAPSVVIGHSAGGALALRLSLTRWPETPVVTFNAALAEFPGLAGVLFPALAKILSISPLSGEFIAMTAASPSNTRRLLASTGGEITEEMLAHYHTLITDPSHVKATLAMMAQWRVAPLRDRLNEITAPVRMVVGDQDRTVPPSTSEEAARRMPSARFIRQEGLGHLAHEQDADAAADEIRAALAE